MDEGISGRVGAAQVGALASIGAGAVHAAAAGIHAEHATLSRLFVAVAALQLGAGLALLLRREWRLVAAGTALVNAGAVAAWATTRITGISWIGGLEQSEAPQFADTVCAALGAIAVIGALLAVRRPAAVPALRGLGVALPSVAISAVAVAAMFSAATHVHSDHGETAAGHDHGTEAEPASAAGATETTAHAHGGPEPPPRRERPRPAPPRPPPTPTATKRPTNTPTSTPLRPRPRPRPPTRTPSRPPCSRPPRRGRGRGIRPTPSTSPASRGSPPTSRHGPRRSSSAR